MVFKNLNAGISADEPSNPSVNQATTSRTEDARIGLRPAPLAVRWDCCRQTIYNMISDGELRSFKVRNSRIIPFSEIERIESGA